MKKKISKTRTKQFEGNSSITDTKDFAGVIEKDEEGKNKLRILSPVWYQHQLNKMKVGEKVSIYLSTRRPKRSEAQNRYYWGVYLPLIANETGERNIEKLHALFSGLFLTEGIYTVLDKQVRIKKSTTELSVSQFIAYIMDIEAETGIEAPPTENFSFK